MNLLATKKKNEAGETVFKQLRFNMWVSSTTAFIPEQVFDQGNAPIDLDSLRGRECYGGLDLSSTVRRGADYDAVVFYIFCIFYIDHISVMIDRFHAVAAHTN